MHKLIAASARIAGGLLLAANSHAGLISGSFTDTTGNKPVVNLTTEGTVDWAVFGLQNYVNATTPVASPSPDARKAGGTSISDLTANTNGNAFIDFAQHSQAGIFSWTDGSALSVSDSDRTAGSVVRRISAATPSLVGASLSLTIAASPIEQVATIYVHTYSSVGTLTATLSDGSDDAYTVDVHTATNTDKGGIFTINFASDTPGQTLNIVWSVNTTIGNNPGIGIGAVTVALVPEPAALSSLAVVAGGLLSRRRRRN
jgi:hypothetical protein